jgi:hypothetical protein
MRSRSLIVAVALSGLWACRTTKPGTHVEVVDKGGTKVYAAGAAAPGISKSVACRGAVGRAAAAIALRFAQDYDDVGDDIADDVGASDGEVFLQRYAKETAMDSAVQDIQFDPIEHICMAQVNWTPPVFVKEAILKFAEKMKQDELSSTPGSEPAPAAPVDSGSGSPPPARPPQTPPPPPVSAAPAPAPAGPAVPACTSARAKLSKVLASSQKALDDFAECKRRTSGDETICHRYKLYAEDAQKKEEAAGAKLVACLNAGLSSNLRRALDDALPGHAAISVETSANGNPILFTFSPVDQTGFSIEVAADGRVVGKTGLAANQVSWVRQQLGL